MNILNHWRKLQTQQESKQTINISLNYRFIHRREVGMVMMWSVEIQKQKVKSQVAM